MVKIRKSIIILLIIFIFLIILKVTIFPPYIYESDSLGYINQIQYLLNENSLVNKDYVDGKIKPTSYKTRLLLIVTYITIKLLNLEQSKIPLTIAIFNFISWICLVILSFYITYFITKNQKISIITLMLTLSNVNVFINSIFILTDITFSFLLAVFILFFIFSIRNIKILNFLSAGILLGILTLARTIPKFLVLVLIPIIFLLKEITINKKLIISLIFIIGFFLPTTPFLIRNYYKLNFLGLDTNEGVTSLWSAINIVRINEKDKDDPLVYEIKEIIINGKEKGLSPSDIEIEIRKKLLLSEAQTSKYLKKIAIDAILTTPFSFLKIFIKNLIDNITSANSELVLIDIFKKDFYKEYNRIKTKVKYNIKNINLKDFLIIFPNIFFRILHLSLFIFCILGIIEFTKEYKNEGLLLTIILSYFLILSSIVAGSDRFRLPIEIIFNILISYKIYNYITKTNKMKSKNKIFFF